MLADDLVRNGVILSRHLDERLPGRIRGLADRLGDFIGFAEAETDAPLFVARDNEGAEGEAAAAFDHLGAAIDEHDLFGQVRLLFRLIALRPAAAVLTRFCHKTIRRLELKTAFARRVGERFDFAMVAGAATVEYDFRDLLGAGAF